MDEMRKEADDEYRANLATYREKMEAWKAQRAGKVFNWHHW